MSRSGEKKRTVRIPTNIKVKAKSWSAKSWSAKSQSVIRGKSSDYSTINKTLLVELEKVNEIIAELTLRGRFQLPEIKQRYLELYSPVTQDFFGIYDEFLSVKEKSMTRNGIKDFKTLKTHLLGFEKDRGGKIVLSQIDLTFFEKFENYLSALTITRKVKDSDEVEMILFADSTILKNLQTLRVFLNGQQNRGLPVNKSYKKFKIRSKPVPTLVTLEPDEYRLLLNKVENERLEKVRKLFVLQCATGLRYSDIIKIRKNHVRNNHIFMISTKTRQKLQIPINDNSKEILNACNFDTSTISISNQKYNDEIQHTDGYWKEWKKPTIVDTLKIYDDEESITKYLLNFKYYSINEVAEMLSFSRPTIYKLINDGKVKAIRINGQMRIKHNDLTRYINSGNTELHQLKK